MAQKKDWRLKLSWRAVLLLVALLAGPAALAKDGDVHVIQSIKSVASGVDIEIKSSKPFLQSDLPVLKIGGMEFTISRSPDDGDLNRLIFMLTSDEFAKLSTGEKVTFQYGRGEGRNPRDFGRLDKSKMVR